MNKLAVLFPLLLTACTIPLKGSHETSSQTNASAQTFTCEGNGQVLASYSTNGETAYLQVTIPQVNLSKQNVELQQAVSASGVRYVNESDPELSYEWHIKNQEGIMSVYSSDGEQYSTLCNASL